MHNGCQKLSMPRYVKHCIVLFEVATTAVAKAQQAVHDVNSYRI